MIAIVLMTLGSIWFYDLIGYLQEITPADVMKNDVAHCTTQDYSIKINFLNEQNEN